MPIFPLFFFFLSFFASFFSFSHFLFICLINCAPLFPTSWAKGGTCPSAPLATGLIISLYYYGRRSLNPCNLFIYFACLLRWLSVSNRLNWSGPLFLWDLAWPQERFMNDRIFKKFASNKFRFLKILKIYTFLSKVAIFLFVNIVHKWNRSWAWSALKA